MSDTHLEKIDVVLKHGMQFEATNSLGAVTVMDASLPLGQNAGLTPMEHLLAGLGGCTAMDVISILRKKRLEVAEYRLDIVGARRSDHPKVYEHISIRHILTGDKIPEEAVSHAIHLSEEKYCSAYAMLGKAASISTSFEVRSREAVGAVA